ncbi:hypothetical protein Ddye_015416 [Dipteronia dyeriana]|uniref:MULE transposase domain-containing protein n=1 Tax=Dipteronia dyeriana TaxID=168575 RepID=A0AAD9WZA4_9ROSI|nr:hypothetical protein Ddye_015416 [Dipteronia dyeriana]
MGSRYNVICDKGAFGHIDDLVFISDRHVSIKAGISKVFPDATHTIYCRHFSENVKKRFHRKDVTAIMDKTARLYAETKYNRYKEELSNLHQNAFDYVNDVDLSSRHNYDVCLCLWVWWEGISPRHDYMLISVSKPGVSAMGRWTIPV